jgi:hypothetical protein
VPLALLVPLVLLVPLTLPAPLAVCRRSSLRRVSLVLVLVLVLVFVPVPMLRARRSPRPRPPRRTMRRLPRTVRALVMPLDPGASRDSMAPRTPVLRELRLQVLLLELIHPS